VVAVVVAIVAIIAVVMIGMVLFLGVQSDHSRCTFTFAVAASVVAKMLS
jgi:hypothetical protein